MRKRKISIISAIGIIMAAFPGTPLGDTPEGGGPAEGIPEENLPSIMKYLNSLPPADGVIIEEFELVPVPADTVPFWEVGG